MDNSFKKTFITVVITSIVISSVFGGAVGFWAGLTATNTNVVDWIKTNYLNFNPSENQNNNSSIRIVSEESAVIDAVNKVSPAVVSVIVTKDLPKIRYNTPLNNDFFQQFFGDQFNNFFGNPNDQNQDNGSQGGTQKVEIGGGTGFIIASDGYIVTNKHVVSDEQADYTILLNNEKKYPAKVLARDPMSDLAVLKIDAKNLPTVEFGESTGLKVGQSVIAIGNALGEFRNTVSVGVISGLSRSIIAGDNGLGSESLTGVIQTDASINPGNSGGPLLNIAGQVIGINTAIAQGAQNIGFTIPINDVKNSIESVQKFGKIIRPWLGVRYMMINKDLATANNLPVDYGALISRGQTQSELAVIPGSPADKAGIVENDIILEIDGKKLDSADGVANIINKHKVGDTVTLKIMHKGQEKKISIKLEEMK
jgi:serine protease Do